MKLKRASQLKFLKIMSVLKVSTDADLDKLSYRCDTDYGTRIYSDRKEPMLEAFDHTIDARLAQVWNDPTTGYVPGYKPDLTPPSKKPRKSKNKDQSRDQGVDYHDDSFKLT